MIKSASLQQNILEYLSDGLPRSISEIKIHLKQTGISDYSEGQFSGSINTLLRNQSIKKVSRAVYTINQNSGGVSMKTCFVVSPIGEEGSEIRDSADKLFRHIISPVCKKCGLEPIRVDQINHSDSITQTIIDQLASADLVIADLSGQNPNVFYEMGYRRHTEKPIIHLKRKGETIPFDVNTINTFEYDLTDLDHVERTRERLQKTIETFSFESTNAQLNQNDDQDKQSSNILSILYQIQDSISALKEQVSQKNTETIQTIMQTSLNNAKSEESTETAIIKVLLPELMKNPDLIHHFKQIAELANPSAK